MSGLSMDVDTCRLATRIPLHAPFWLLPILFPPVSSTCHWSATKPRTEVGNCLVDAFGLCEQVIKQCWESAQAP